MSDGEVGHGTTTWTCSCHGKAHATDGLAWLCEQRSARALERDAEARDAKADVGG